MNNIYKVIWSKAKNCYVVASEIARSHTKSASGSEKIGGVARHALLALGAACAIACGGFVNVGAYTAVDVSTPSAGVAKVYDADTVDSMLKEKADKSNTFTKEQTYTQAQVKKLINDLQTGDVATNKNNITTLEGKTVGLSTDGKSLNGMNSVETGALTVTGQISNGADVTTTLTDIKASMDKADANGDAIGELQTKTAEISHEAGGGTNISGVTIKNGNIVGDGNSAITGLTNVGTLSINGKSLEGNMVATDKEVKDAVKAETDAREVADTALEGKINAEEKAREAKDKELRGRIGTVEKDGNYIKNSNTNNVSQNVRVLDAQVKVNEDAIAAEKTAREAADTKLEGKITKNSEDIATLNGKVTTAQGDITALQAKDNELARNIQTNADNIQTNSNAIADINKRTAGIDRIDATKETTIEGHVTVDNLGNVKAKGNVTADGKLTGKGVDAGDGAITTTGAVNAGSLTVENASNLKGDVTMDKKLSVTGDTSLKKTDVDGALNVTGESSLKNTKVEGMLTTTGKATFQEAVEMDKGLTVTSGDTTLKGKLTVTDDAELKNTEVKGTLGVTGATTLSGELTAEKNATFEKDVTVKGTTTLKNTTVDGNLKVTGTITTDKMIFGDKATQNYTEIDHGKVTSKNLLVVTGTAETISSSSTFNAEENKVGFANSATGDQSFHKQTSDVIMDNVKDGKNSNNRTQTKTETKDIITDEKDNSSTTSQTASQNKTYLTDKDRKNTNSTIDTAKGYDKTIKGENGKTSTKQDELNITNTAKDGTITNDAKNIVNNAATMDTTVTGKATESYGELETTVNGKETHNVTGTKTENVTGKVTENYNGGQETNVTGNQDIHVTKNQTNKIDGDQVNIIGGSQTTTATDINRNASSGMIDTVENASGSNKETKVAGQTTTDVKLASGEEGHYIRGATESRDYLLNGTLKNSETKTAEATSSEVTDGTNKASTIQDAKNLAGSVTNGTETGISGIHANKDGSVSIDSTVVGGGMSSVINQKKDSIQSAVGDGTSSTVIRQDKDNVAIASSNGTVAIGGKDIVNNASNSITDKVGDNTRVTTSTSITDTVGTANRKIENGKIIDTADDSTVTTENGKGTTFTKTGSTAYSTAAGAPTDTNIAGNHITTGRVDANELGVSDKDGANTADFSVEAGERKGVKASAGNGTTTGSLDVTAEEVSSSVKDASGKGSTFKQRIDAIMMESKEVSIKAEETLTNEAKVITNKASEVINNEAVNINNTATGIINSKASEIKNQADKLISNKVGENTSEYMEDGKITTSVKDGAKSTVTIQNADGLQTGVTNGTSTNASATTATSSAQTIASGNKANSVITTIDGTQFVNTDAAVPVTGASGAGTAVNTTIKGNTITTGKVTMDYADVMKDLGVRGNANITGKTTTGSLEVTGTSTLKGDVTMENNATVGNNLTVNGTTKTKTLNVTENAEVGGELKVAKKATFEDSVSIAKDLTVGGDVTAKSYKVGDKTYISADGINANDQKITNVADGSISEGSKDAVNGGQLYQVKNDLEGKVNKVGANAAAMANLHPMEFDPDSKWNIAAAMGNYGSETATAIGAFYRPNEDVMVNFSTAFGTGENMVGGGVSVRLGKGGNKLSREENNALKDQVNDLTARMDALLSVLNPNMSKDFPDVPENHWAYEAVSRLAGNDIVQGYPDGEFHGDRTMTRYEMAEIIYNALSRGAEAERELVEEFKPELQAMAASEKATAEKAEG